MPEPQNPTAILWERLRAEPPNDAAARAAADYDAARQAYRVRLLDQELCVVPSEERVEGPDGPTGFQATLVCIQYLLTSRDEALRGEAVDPKSLPYGQFFFRGLHDLPTAKLEAAFGDRLDAFRAAAEAIGGRPLAMGDAAYEFRALPRVPVTVVLWGADEEFPARARFLFDKAADRQLPLDALWVLSGVVARRLIAAGG